MEDLKISSNPDLEDDYEIPEFMSKIAEYNNTYMSYKIKEGVTLWNRRLSSASRD